jgi:hypothetical protein
MRDEKESIHLESAFLSSLTLPPSSLRFFLASFFFQRAFAFFL